MSCQSGSLKNMPITVSPKWIARQATIERLTTLEYIFGRNGSEQNKTNPDIPSTTIHTGLLVQCRISYRPTKYQGPFTWTPGPSGISPGIKMADIITYFCLSRLTIMP